MPTLNWIGKEAVVNHHLDVPFHLLRDVPELACGEPGSGNLIVQGDNLTALKALLPYYAGQVKCIYIDPPYNTGNEGWAYNDNVNSPVIREWLGKVVGKEGETLDRHDRWLCMMYPRLALLREFLREDGAIFVSIGDTEVAALVFLLDEIFGSRNRLPIFSWKSRAKPVNIGEAKVRPQQASEYLCAYARDAEKVKFYAVGSGEARSYPLKTAAGRRYRLQTILKSNRGENARATMRFSIAGFTPALDQRWQGGEAFIQGLLDMGYLEFKEGIPFRRYFEDEEPDENDPLYSFLPPEWTGTAETGKAELNQVLGNQHGFDTVKPTLLLNRLFTAATNPGDLVLDSFAGSGTTGHAVLKLNAAQWPRAKDAEDAKEEAEILGDPGVLGARPLPRRFILVEMEPKIARGVTAERVRRVADGYTNGKGGNIESLGGSFRFCELGERLFDEHGRIRETVRFADLARHVYFSETGEPLPKERISAKTPLLGVHHGRAVYLLYNGILKDRSVDGGNVLTRTTLDLLPAHAGPRVVYAAGSRFSKARLEREGITFKQTPYAIRTR